MTIVAGEADEWWWRVRWEGEGGNQGAGWRWEGEGGNQGAGWRWRIVVEAMEEGGRMGEGSGDGLSIVEERPSGVWRRLRGGGGEIS